MRVLLIGDIVGKGGRRAVKQFAPLLREEYGCEFCIANAENAAGGAGITEKCALELKNAQVDVITLGDHVWDQKEFAQQIDGLPFVVRPANFSGKQPGRGHVVMELPGGAKICVINETEFRYSWCPA